MSYQQTKTSELSEPLLDTEDPDSPHEQKGAPARLWTVQNVVASLAVCIIFFLAGIFAQRILDEAAGPPRPSHNHGLLAPYGSEKQIWEHNPTFSRSPTRESESAWDSIVPIGRGFIHHEKIAPFISNIAVFHQLHCLHSLLVAHYALEAKAQHLEKQLSSDGAQEPESGFVFELYGTHTDTHHIRHCFDYLRRSLMCAADTNLEIVSENRTVNGWGSVKYCRSYAEVIEFAERWRNSSDTGIIT